MKSRPQPFKAILFQWGGIGLGVLVWGFYLFRLFSSPTHPPWLEFSLFGLAILIISLKPIYITTPGMLLGHKRQLSLSLSDALTFLLLILHGPAAAIVMAGLDGLVASIRTVRRWQSNVFTLAMFALSLFATAKAYEMMMQLQGMDPYAGLQHPPLQLLLPLYVGATAYFVVNSFLVGTIIALRYRKSIWQQIVDNHLWTGVTFFPLATFSIVLYACIQRYGWVSVIATVPIFFIIYISYVQYNQKVEEKLHKIEEMNDLNQMTVEALALAIDARSGSSPGHAERVKVYIRGLAKHFSLSELETEALETGAMLRDIGMLAIPDHILTKPTQLTEAESARMKMHPAIGAEILSQIKFPYPVVPVVRHHHESWNGTGYPDGLQGEEIPFTARILAVADCFDAARESRNHRQAMTLEQAVAWLRTQAGSMFDPQIVEVFIEHLPEAEAEIAALVQKRQTARPSEAPHTANKETPHHQSEQVVSTGYSQSLEQISGVHREVVMLYELAQTVGRSLSLHETLSLLLERLCVFVPSNTSVVLLKEKDEAELRVAHAQGQHADDLKNACITLGTGNIGTVFARLKPAFNVPPRPDLMALGITSQLQYRTSLAVPLVKGHEGLGVLALYTADLATYSSEHIRLVEAVAQLAGDAIANALHYEATETTAYTDRLTGLPNLRGILRAFDQERERARQTGQVYTLMMMDLDGFKAINDTLGHNIGDLFLVEISRLIKSHLRATDFFGRYGGDEFIALLPNAGINETRNTVERIKHTIDNYVFTTDSGATARGGVSIGLTECDGHIATLEELMTKADMAMYADKAERKKRKDISQNERQLSARNPA